MASEVVRTDNRISKITLAYFLDSNWYAGINFKSSEAFYWGKDRGCDFLDSCDFNTFPEFTDPTEENVSGCTHDHYAKSRS